jgi:hypothetical protein
MALRGADDLASAARRRQGSTIAATALTVLVSRHGLPRENIMSHRRRQPLRSAVFALLTCVGLLAFIPAANAAEKVTICHATGSDTHPYVTVTISENAVNAHRNHQNGEDIIPAPATGCPNAVPPPTDVCTNLLGNQSSVPPLYETDGMGNCTPIVFPVPLDVPCVVSAGVTQTADTVTGTSGDDTIDCSLASPAKTIDGFGGNDTITGTQFGDMITGGDGNDTITGLGGNDVLSGNAGNDTISGGDGNDIITGSEGSDTLSGEGGDDTIDGGTGNDTLSGGAGTNNLNGGGGTDICDGPC